MVVVMFVRSSAKVWFSMWVEFKDSFSSWCLVSCIGGRFSFGSWKVVALASSSYTGVRVAVWLSGLCEFLSASLVAYVQCCRLWQHPILLCGCSPFGLQPLVSIPSSSACLFALRLVLLQACFRSVSRLSSGVLIGTQ